MSTAEHPTVGKGSSSIEWTDHTFNPWVGCSKVSPGCAHCYAETLVTGRMARPGTWGEDGVRERTSDSNWRKPLAWERNAERWAAEHDGARQRVFCASLADVFEPRPELEPWRRDLFKLIAQTPSLDWLLLTKRPDVAVEWLQLRYLRYWRDVDAGARPEPMPWTSRDGASWGVHPNIWIGTSIENARHTWRADVLREIPAAVRFISAEPLLGSLFAGYTRKDFGLPITKHPLDLTGIDWVIVGGESGPVHRPMDPEWVREIQVMCEDECVPFFFKQWGGRTPKAGGRELYGRTWDEMPSAEHNTGTSDK